jgi:hypothetical protein
MPNCSSVPEDLPQQMQHLRVLGIVAEPADLAAGGDEGAPELVVRLLELSDTGFGTHKRIVL